ncbi:hypothetical protein JW898_04480 [Candidatus Woesearchaeota archaeon]|nr:hypothetical protein [Candidatus Woesearchaeota archaeon]
MKRLITLVSLVAAVGCGSVVPREFDGYDADNGSADATADAYIPDSAPDADASIPDSDLDAIVSDDSGDGAAVGDSDTPDAAVCDSGPLSFLNQQGIDYNLGTVLLNGDGSFEATSARGWYRNSSAADEHNILPGNYVVLSKDTPAEPGMTGVTRILEYLSYDSTYSIVQFRDLGTSGMMTGTVRRYGPYDVFSVNVGGYTFDGTVDAATGRISVKADGGDAADGRELPIHTAEGAKTMEELLCPET